MDGFGETLIGDVFGIEFEFLNGDTLLSDLGIRLDPCYFEFLTRGAREYHYRSD